MGRKRPGHLSERSIKGFEIHAPAFIDRLKGEPREDHREDLTVVQRRVGAESRDWRTMRDSGARTEVTFPAALPWARASPSTSWPTRCK